MRLKLDKNMVKSRWEEDYELIENEGLFEEYLEMGLYSCFKPLTICLLLTDFVVYPLITLCSIITPFDAFEISCI